MACAKVSLLPQIDSTHHGSTQRFLDMHKTLGEIIEDAESLNGIIVESSTTKRPDPVIVDLVYTLATDIQAGFWRMFPESKVRTEPYGRELRPASHSIDTAQALQKRMPPLKQ